MKLPSVGRFVGLVLALLLTGAAKPDTASSRKAVAGIPATDVLYDRPLLVVDPRMHTATISQAAVHVPRGIVVTGSEDKTVRLWSIANGDLLKTIRIPAGPGNVGKIFAVAISPDGSLIAAGGWTNSAKTGINIYLFNLNGEMIKCISGLPEVVQNLAFSPDSAHLAVVLRGAAAGLRVFDRARGWAKSASDTLYGDGGSGIAFATDGRLAVSSLDGRVRLYDGAFQRVAVEAMTGGHRPSGLTFSPEGGRLAVGYEDSPIVDLLDGHTLKLMSRLNASGIGIGDLPTVAWQKDGQRLFAAGSHYQGGNAQVVVWEGADKDDRHQWPPTSDKITSLVQVSDQGVLVVGSALSLALFDPTGVGLWRHGTTTADFRNQRHTLAVSTDGTTIDFGYGYGAAPTRFDLSSFDLRSNPPTDGVTVPPRQRGLAIADWINSQTPTLDGVRLPLEPYERSLSLAIAPAGGRFVLGSDRFLRAYDQVGKALWRRDAPGVVWATAISGDGRRVVATYGDGTIRWHRLDDGRELLALMPLVDGKNWVAWTPEGYWKASPDASEMVGWHINHGQTRAAEIMPVSEFPEYCRPDLLIQAVREMNLERALDPADQAKAREAARRLPSGKPGARLRLLVIGINDYGKDAPQLRLKYAAADAREVAKTLSRSQKGIYTSVDQIVLTNAEATRFGIFQAFDTIRKGMDQDIAVVMFSGHARVVDDHLYLLPYGVNVGTDYGVKTDSISDSDLALELVKLAGPKGRVLVLLDACYSGVATGQGQYADQWRKALADANVTVLTSSTSEQRAREDDRWKHGAFTKVLLDAIMDTTTDNDKNGMISVEELVDYITFHVSKLTDGGQTPEADIRINGDIFVPGK